MDDLLEVQEVVQRLVQSRHPYVTQRGNVYCFRYTLPRHVRQLCPDLPTEIKRSLRTDSFCEAVHLVDQKRVLIRRVRQCRDGGLLKALCGRLADFSGELESMVGISSEEGIEKAKRRGVYQGGKKTIDREKVLSLLADGVGPAAIAKQLGIGRMSVYRIKEESAQAS